MAQITVIGKPHHLIHLQRLGQHVGNEEHSGLALEAVDGAGEVFRRFGVQVAGDLVEDEDFRVLQKRAGDGQALALPAGEPHAVLAQPRLVALRQLLDHIVYLREFTGLHNVLEVRVRVRGDEIVVDAAGEQHGLLRHHAVVAPKLVGGHAPDVPAIEQNLALRGHVEAHQEFCQRAFSAAGWPHDDSEFAGFKRQVQATVQVRVFLGIAEAHLFQLDLADAGGFAHGRQCMGLGRHVHDVRQPRNGYLHLRLLEFLLQAHKALHGLASLAR